MTVIEQVGTRGSDEYGAMYINSLKRARVRMDKVRSIAGPTGTTVQHSHVNLFSKECINTPCGVR